MTNIESIIEFIERSKTIDISNVDKGYRVTCYLAEQDKWNSPQCTIWITDCLLPQEEYGVEVEYRKEQVFKSDSKDVSRQLRDKVGEAYGKLQEAKKEALQEEFEAHIKIPKKQ